MSARLSSTAGRYAACSGRRTLAMSRGHAKGWPRAQPTRGVGSLGRSGYGSGRDCTKERSCLGGVDAGGSCEVPAGHITPPCPPGTPVWPLEGLVRERARTPAGKHNQGACHAAPRRACSPACLPASSWTILVLLVPKMLSARNKANVRRAVACACGKGWCGGSTTGCGVGESTVLQPVEGERHEEQAVQWISAATGEEEWEVVARTEIACPSEHAELGLHNPTAASHGLVAPALGRYGVRLPGAGACQKSNRAAAKKQLASDAGGMKLAAVTEQYVLSVLGGGTGKVNTALAATTVRSLRVVALLTDGLDLSTLWARHWNGHWHRQHFVLRSGGPKELALRSKKDVVDGACARVALHPSLYPPSALERAALSQPGARRRQLDLADAEGAAKPKAQARKKSKRAPKPCPGVEHAALTSWVRLLFVPRAAAASSRVHAAVFLPLPCFIPLVSRLTYAHAFARRRSGHSQKPPSVRRCKTPRHFKRRGRTVLCRLAARRRPRCATALCTRRSATQLCAAGSCHGRGSSSSTSPSLQGSGPGPGHQTSMPFLPRTSTAKPDPTLILGRACAWCGARRAAVARSRAPGAWRTATRLTAPGAGRAAAPPVAPTARR